MPLSVLLGRADFNEEMCLIVGSPVSALNAALSFTFDLLVQFTRKLETRNFRKAGQQILSH